MSKLEAVLKMRLKQRMGLEGTLNPYDGEKKYFILHGFL